MQESPKPVMYRRLKLLWRQAAALAEEGQQQQALQTFRIALRQSEREESLKFQTLMLMGQSCMKMGVYSSAVQIFQKCVKSSKQSTFYYIALLDLRIAYFSQGDYLKSASTSQLILNFINKGCCFVQNPKLALSNELKNLSQCYKRVGQVRRGESYQLLYRKLSSQLGQLKSQRKSFKKTINSVQTPYHKKNNNLNAISKIHQLKLSYHSPLRPRKTRTHLSLPPYQEKWRETSEDVKQDQEYVQFGLSRPRCRGKVSSLQLFFKQQKKQIMVKKIENLVSFYFQWKSFNLMLLDAQQRILKEEVPSPKVVIQLLIRRLADQKILRLIEEQQVREYQLSLQSLNYLKRLKAISQGIFFNKNRLTIISEFQMLNFGHILKIKKLIKKCYLRKQYRKVKSKRLCLRRAATVLVDGIHMVQSCIQYFNNGNYFFKYIQSVDFPRPRQYRVFFKKAIRQSEANESFVSRLIFISKELRFVDKDYYQFHITEIKKIQMHMKRPVKRPHSKYLLERKDYLHGEQVMISVMFNREENIAKLIVEKTDRKQKIIKVLKDEEIKILLDYSKSLFYLVKYSFSKRICEVVYNGSAMLNLLSSVSKKNVTWRQKIHRVQKNLQYLSAFKAKKRESTSLFKSLGMLQGKQRNNPKSSPELKYSKDNYSAKILRFFLANFYNRYLHFQSPAGPFSFHIARLARGAFVRLVFINTRNFLCRKSSFSYRITCAVLKLYGLELVSFENGIDFNEKQFELYCSQFQLKQPTKWLMEEAQIKLVLSKSVDSGSQQSQRCKIVIGRQAEAECDVTPFQDQVQFEISQKGKSLSVQVKVLHIQDQAFVIVTKDKQWRRELSCRKEETQGRSLWLSRIRDYIQQLNSQGDGLQLITQKLQGHISALI